MQFNKNQLKVINHTINPVAIIAGAGSGKSTVLVERVQTLLANGESPSDIAVITFGKNSSEDLKKKFTFKKIKGVNIGTFHAFCKRILVSEGIDTSKEILDYQYENELKRIDKDVKYKEVKSFIGFQKSYGIGVKDNFINFSSDYSETTLREFYKTYEEFNKKQKAFDMDDWLLLARNILIKYPNKYTYKYIMVDESQDNNTVFNDLAKLLCPSGNVMFIGDFRQSIYAFRGSNPELFMNFNVQYPNATVINLNTNYRSTNNIVNNSNNFIKKYYGDYEFYEDSISSNINNGDVKIFDNDCKEDEAKKIVDDIEKKLKQGSKPNEIAILYRLNQNSFDIEMELKSKNIPYFMHSTDSSFFNRREISCLMCMLRLIDNPHDDMAYNTVLNSKFYPFTMISNDTKSSIYDLSVTKKLSYYDTSDLIHLEKSYQKNNLTKFNKIITDLIIQYKKSKNLTNIVDTIISLMKIEDSIRTNNKYNDEQVEERLTSLVSFKSFLRENTLQSFIAFVYGGSKNDKKCTDDSVQLMTIHKSKGLEFENVYLVSIEDGKFPNKKAPLDEEARLFYVATTRAKENLYLSQIYENNRFVNEYLN